MGRTLQQQKLKWRIGRRTSSDLQWETSCSSVAATVSQIIEWNLIKDCQNPTATQKEIQNAVGACCHKHYWLYADYKYMKNIFNNRPDMLESLRWEDLGFKGKTGEHSTMWIGTAGAYTLCHYDTYGYNIVIQISGSKRWVFFPPSDTNSLYPTRIPYEESSVFSEVNLSNPDLEKHPRFSKASACSVVLRPGDMLYVPRHWWHYVENLELSTSINLWYEIESDMEDRLKESIARLLVGGFAKNLDGPWANPNEDTGSIESTKESLGYLNRSLNEVTQANINKELSETSSHPQVFLRNGGTTNPIIIKPLNTKNFIESGITDLLLPSRENPCNGAVSPAPSSGGQKSAKVSYNEFVKTLTHPVVIATIANVLQSDGVTKSAEKTVANSNGEKGDSLELVSVSSEMDTNNCTDNTERDIMTTPSVVDTSEQIDDYGDQVLLPPSLIPIKLEHKTQTRADSTPDADRRHPENPRIRYGFTPHRYVTNGETEVLTPRRYVTCEDTDNSGWDDTNDDSSILWRSESRRTSNFPFEFAQSITCMHASDSVMHDHHYSSDFTESMICESPDVLPGASRLERDTSVTVCVAESGDDSTDMVEEMPIAVTRRKRSHPIRNDKRAVFHTSKIFKIFKDFPLQSMKQMEEWEKKLSDARKFNQLVNALKHIEEKTAGSYAYKVMGLLFSETLARICSLSGRNGKHGVGSSRILQAVFKAAHLNEFLPKNEKTMIRRRVGSWLATCWEPKQKEKLRRGPKASKSRSFGNSSSRRSGEKTALTTP